MAARRLLIVMLVLLGLSTLAAALVPQRTLRTGTTTGTTAQPAQTLPTVPEISPLPPVAKITVGGKKFPVVAPVRVGEQITLLARSRVPTQLEIPEFGLLGFAAPDAPARFELLADTAGSFGILFSPSGKVAARIDVTPAPKKEKGKTAKSKSAKRKAAREKPAAKSRARAGSG